MEMTRTKKVIAALAALVLTVTMAAPALALGEIDLDQKGVITTTVAEDDYRQDLLGQEELTGTAAQVGLKVYQVATVNEYGAFTATEPFKSLEDDPAWNGGIITNKANAAAPAGDEQVKTLLALALALVKPDEDEGEDEGGEAAPSIAPLFDGMVPAVNGTVQLGETVGELGGVGLYLVVPEHVTTVLWEYEFSPALLAVPSIEREKDAEGNLTDPDDGTWVYSVPMYLKSIRERRLMELDISKTLQTYNRTLGPVTFVFDVVAWLDGRVVFQSTAQITFDDTTGATQTVRVSNIPAGAQVTVTEVYTGQSYTLTGVNDGGIDGAQAGGGSVTFEITELTLPEGQDVHRVGFTNDYSGGRIPEASVENVFTANGESRWSWVKDNSEGGNG